MFKRYRPRFVRWAYQWNGDLDGVVTSYYETTDRNFKVCGICGKPLGVHGVVRQDPSLGDRMVCPGRMIVRAESEAIFTTDHEAFLSTYELDEDD